MTMTTDEVALHSNLADWITRNGGSIHRNLTLHTPETTNASPILGGDGANVSNTGGNQDITVSDGQQSNRYSQRGIFAKYGPIKKGEFLIRLPQHLALDGSELPSSYACRIDTDELTISSTGKPSTTETQQQRNASPWLRCLSALISAWSCQEEHPDNHADGIKEDHVAKSASTPQSKPINFFNPYLASLPEEYDSLLNWSALEIQSFLAGTALGVAALQDACTTIVDSNENVEDSHERVLRERFVRTVLPYLLFLKEDGLAFQGDDGDTPSNPKRSKRQKMDKENEAEQSKEAELLYNLFRNGCMCISTRAFHMQSPSAADTKSSTNDDIHIDNCYQGPYLLPYIDLLNHSARGSSKHVTTLRRDPDGSFYMVAERDIEIDEEICHSYDSGAAIDENDSSDKKEKASSTKDRKEESSSLNSAQLLQTFGFVDADGAGGRLMEYYQNKDAQTIDKECISNLGNVTPAVLTKNEISCACKKLASSTYPKTLRRFMDESGMSDEGWEYWELPTLDQSGPRWESLALFPDELIVPFGGSLSDELITICCLHFLPDDVINELLDEPSMEGRSDERKPHGLLLGNEVLEDYFLGKLVLQAIINTLKEKLHTYRVDSANLLSGCKGRDQLQQLLEVLSGLYSPGGQSGRSLFCWGEKETEDARVLSKITSSSEGKCSDMIQKFKFGMVISLEERACLLELKKTVIEMLAQLDGEETTVEVQLAEQT